MAEKRNRYNNKYNMTTLLTILILKMLSKNVNENHYGNKMISQIEAQLVVYKPSPGTIYPILNSLEVDGFIKGHWDDAIKKSVKRYRITDEGIKKLRSLEEIYSSIIREEIILLQNIAKALDMKI